MNHPQDVTPLATIDWTRITDAVNRAAAAFRTATEQTALLVTRMTHAIHTAANDPVHVAGVEGRWIVRGGLDPTYRWEDNARAMAVALMNGRHPDTALLTPDNRALVATGFLRGWVQTHHPAELAAIAAETTPTYDALVSAL